MDIRTAACHFYRFNKMPIETGVLNDASPDTACMQTTIRDTFQALQQLPKVMRDTVGVSLSVRRNLYRLFIAVKKSDYERTQGRMDLFQIALQRACPGQQPDLLVGRMSHVDAASMLNVRLRLPSFSDFPEAVGRGLLSFFSPAERINLIALRVALPQAPAVVTSVWTPRDLANSVWVYGAWNTWAELDDGVTVTASPNRLWFWKSSGGLSGKRDYVGQSIYSIKPLPHDRFATTFLAATGLNGWQIWRKGCTMGAKIAGPPNTVPLDIALLTTGHWVTVFVENSLSRDKKYFLQVHSAEGKVLSACARGSHLMMGLTTLPDGKFAVISHGDVTVWSPSPANAWIYMIDRQLSPFVPADPWRFVARTSDGKLALGTLSGAIGVWDVASGAFTSLVAAPSQPDHGELEQLLALPSRGKVVARYRDAVWLWDHATLPPIQLSRGLKSRVLTVRANLENEVILTYQNGIRVRWTNS